MLWKTCPFLHVVRKHFTLIHEYTYTSHFALTSFPKSAYLLLPKFTRIESLHKDDKAPVTFILHWQEGEKKGREETEKRVREFKSELRTRTFHPRLTKGLSTWESQGGGRDSVNFQHTFFQWTKLTCITGALSAHSASTGGVSAEQLACCKFTP